MTVPSTKFREDYAGNGSATSFPYAFRIFKNTDLVVTKTDNSGNETTLTLGTDYTVTGAGSYNGGAVVLTTALPTSYRLTIERVLAIRQDTDLRNQGEFLAETHEDAFDRLTMIVQRLAGYLGMGQDGTLRTLLLGTGDVDGAGAFRARGNRISGLGNPVSGQDAVTKAWFDQAVTTSVNQAANSAASAAASAAAAEDSEQASLVIATQFGDMATAITQTEAARDTALSAKNAAQSSATSAASSATSASTAKSQAEAARDAAQLSAGVYADTAAGIAAVADGEQFHVVAPDGLSVLCYRRDPGQVAIFLTSYPSAYAATLARRELDVKSSVLSANVVDATASATGYTYIIDSAIAKAGRLGAMRIFGKAAGTVKVKRYTLSGGVYTYQGGSPDIQISNGVQEVNLDSLFGGMQISAGDYIGLYFAGGAKVSYVSDSVNGYSFSQANGDNTTTISKQSNSPLVFQIGFDLYEAKSANDVVASAAAGGDAAAGLFGEVKYNVGRPSGVALVDGTAIFGQAYIRANPFTSGGAVSEFSFFSKAAGSVMLSKYTLSGGAFTRTGSVVVNAAAGLNTFDSAALGGFSVAAGEYVGVIGAGTVTYLQTTSDGLGDYFCGTGSSVAAGSITMGYQLQWRAVVTTVEQIVTADAVKNLQSTVALHTQQLANAANPLAGKKIVAIGDSMVKGHNLPDSQTWLAVLANRAGATYINYGINGTYLSDYDYNGSKGAVIRYVNMVSDADYVLVFAGTNDAANAVPIGADNSVNNSEFNGALNNLISGLITKYPAKKIGFITPYKRNAAYLAYIAAIKARCAEHGIAVFDNATLGGVDWGNAAQVSALTLGDTYHLNATGMVNASTKYEHFLKSL